MTMADNLATAEIQINVSKEKVWTALTDPSYIKKYMFDTNVETDWKEGSDIFWRGEWNGKNYEDKGKIIRNDNKNELTYTHYSPMSGEEDRPENYHTVNVVLTENDKGTRVLLTQNNNPTAESAKHSSDNWKMILETMKKLLEEK
jgi:uncharacterized protein YndB with AHSA1/START domain